MYCLSGEHMDNWLKCLNGCRTMSCLCFWMTVWHMKICIWSIRVRSMCCLKVRDYLLAADYISSSQYEGVPLGLLEAMTEGLPVLLSDNATHREIYMLGKKADVLFTLNDAECFDCARSLLRWTICKHLPPAGMLFGSTSTQSICHRSIRNCTEHSYDWMWKATESHCECMG